MLWFGREKGVREKERGSATLGFDLFLFCFVLNFSPILSLSLSLCPPPFFFLGGGDCSTYHDFALYSPHREIRSEVIDHDQTMFRR